MNMERLDKYLSSRSVLSRRDAQKKIKSGEVTLDGEVCRQIDRKVCGESVVALNGQTVSSERFMYIMMNKPAGVVSATEDKREKTVLDILPPELRRRGLFPAGRLDKDTEGLLIITNDGEMAHRMLSPKKHVEKTYIATLDKPAGEQTIEAFERGIVLSDGTEFMPAKLKLDTNDNNVATVTICEGKFHQVKRMFAACGLNVVHLKRISIGNLYLDSNLPIGSCKSLTNLEIQAVFIGNIH